MNQTLKTFLQETAGTLTQYLESAREHVLTVDGEVPVCMDKCFRELDGVLNQVCRILALQPVLPVLSCVPVSARSDPVSAAAPEPGPSAPSGPTAGPSAPSDASAPSGPTAGPSALSSKRKRVDALLSVEPVSVVKSAWGHGKKKKKRVRLNVEEAEGCVTEAEAAEGCVTEGCVTEAEVCEESEDGGEEKYGFPRVLEDADLLEKPKQRNMFSLFLSGAEVRDFVDHHLKPLYEVVPHRRDTFYKMRTLVRCLLKLNVSWGIKSGVTLDKSRDRFLKVLSHMETVVNWYLRTCPSCSRVGSSVLQSVQGLLSDVGAEHEEFREDVVSRGASVPSVAGPVHGKRPRYNLSVPPASAWITRANGGKLLLPRGTLSALNVPVESVGDVSSRVVGDVSSDVSSRVLPAKPKSLAVKTTRPMPVFQSASLSHTVSLLSESDGESDAPKASVEDADAPEVAVPTVPEAAPAADVAESVEEEQDGMADLEAVLCTDSVRDAVYCMKESLHWPKDSLCTQLSPFGSPRDF